MDAVTYINLIGFFFCTGPLFEVDVQPNMVISFDTEPFNTFTLTCTAIVHDSVTVHKTIHWTMGPQGSEVDVSDNGDTVVITNTNLNSPVSTSVLQVTEDVIGNYPYTCTAVLQFSGEEDDISASDTASVTIKGIDTPPVRLYVTFRQDYHKTYPVIKTYTELSQSHLNDLLIISFR